MKSIPVAFSDVGIALAGCAVLGDEKLRSVLHRHFLLLYKLCLLLCLVCA